MTKMGIQHNQVPMYVVYFSTTNLSTITGGPRLSGSQLL